MQKKIIVSGVGCCLVDLLFNDINFSGEAIRPFLSRTRGDGGLTPGHLVFQEEFEKYCGLALPEVLKRITGGRTHDKINIGGPSIVSLINLAQLTVKEHCEVRFYGRGGSDEPGEYLLSALNKTPVVLRDYRISDKRTPSTVVLSDPSFDNGNGERMFINSIGAAWDYRPEDLDSDFFHSDIVVFGGTALVPHIHDNLTKLLKQAKSKNAVTVVNTVFDFRSEKSDPAKKWPLGESDDSYRFIDLLITDREEAQRLSGMNSLEEATNYFIEKDVSAFIITDGSRNVILYSGGRFFMPSDVIAMPVSKRVTEELLNYQGGDTTGCGDNFTGGVISSLVSWLSEGTGQPDLGEACCWGVVSGGFTCFYMGGTYLEERPGEKMEKMRSYYESYREQIGKWD